MDEDPKKKMALVGLIVVAVLAVGAVVFSAMRSNPPEGGIVSGTLPGGGKDSSSGTGGASVEGGKGSDTAAGAPAGAEQSGK